MSQGIKPYTILVVENDLGVSRLVEKGLKREGYQTSAAATGAEALSWLGNHWADLLLLDLKLPDTNGDGLLDALKEKRARIPFVVMNDNGNEKVAAHFIKRGALDYITMDGSFLELLPAVVAQAMRHVESQRDLEASQEDLAKSERLANRQVSRLRVLETLIRQISSKQHKKDFFDSIVVAARQLFGAELARLHRLCPDGETLQPTNENGVICTGTVFERIPSKKYPLYCEILCERRTVFIEDVQKDPRWRESEWAEKERIHSYIGAPLVVDGKIEGILACYSRTPAFFDESDADLLGSLAAHAAVAIAMARSYEILQAQSERQRALLDITRELTQNLDLALLLNNICESVAKLLQVPFSQLFILDEKGENFVRVGQSGQIKAFEDRGISLPKDRGMVGRLAQAQKPISVTNVVQDPAWVAHEWADKAGVKNFLGVPLFLNGGVGGVLNVYTTDEREFIPDEINLMERFAEQAAIGLQNANLHQRIASSERLHRTLFEKGQDGIEILDESGRLLDVNQRACEIFGYTRQELIGKSIVDILTPEFRDSFPDRVRKAFERKREPHQVLAFRKDGTTVPIEVNLGFIELEGEKRLLSFVRDITERKKAELQLERFRAILDQAGEALNITDVETGRFVDVNQTACRMLGYTREELLELGPADIEIETPFQTPEAWAEHCSNIKKADSTVVLENCVNRRKDGSLVPIEASLLYQTFGGRDYILAVVRDITERNRVDAEFRATQSRLQTILDTASDAIISTEESQRIILFNQQAEDMFGYRAEEVIGQPLDLLLPARYRADHKGYVSQFARQEHPRKMMSERPKLFAVRKNGEEFPVEVSIGKCEIENDLIFTAVVRDVTDRIRSEKQLAHVHAETKQLLSSVPSLLIGLNQDEHITLWNPTAERVFQIPATVATGLSLFECGMNCDMTQMSRLISDCRTQAQPVRSPDIKYTRPDGKDGLLGFTATPIGDEGNGKRGVLLVGAELTKHRFLETQSVHAQKLESIGQLAAGIAHEINTPTQYVADNTRFLSDAFADLGRPLELCGEIAKAGQSGTLPPALIQEMETAIQEADLDYLKNEIPNAIQQSLEGIERVSNIVRAMKEFSHPGPEGKTKADINKLIENTITVARNEWKYVAEMVTELAPDLPLVPCLPNEFNQVILNIVINAAHAIGDVVGDGSGGKGIITVSTHHKGDWVEIRIQDTGNGIPAHVRSKVFDPFFTTKGVGKGTGQGLAISHSVIKDKHNGLIFFETEEGKGTTFIIRLPVTEEEP